MPDELPEGLDPFVHRLAAPLIESACEAGWKVSAKWENRREQHIEIKAKSPSGRSFLIVCKDKDLAEKLISILER